MTAEGIRAERARIAGLAVAALIDPTRVYTDGSCQGNPGPGGWAWAIHDKSFASGSTPQTTNQRMEVTAAFEAVQAIEGRLEVISDSTYVVNCFRNRWHEGWRKRGWKNAKREPVANRDLWEPFIELVLERGDVTFSWVKGHNGDPMNDLVDLLATDAAAAQKGRTGNLDRLTPMRTSDFQTRCSALKLTI